MKRSAMKAAVFRQHGGPEVIEIADVAAPEVPPGHILIGVRAAAMNHLDLWARRGLPGLRLEFPHVGGSDIAGVVEALGDVAEYVAVPAINVYPIPDDLSFESAAAVPLVYQTAWRGMVARGGLRNGETVLVTGASGGVSTAAIQIAKHFGATVFAVTAGAENVRRVERLGADYVIDRLESDFPKAVWKATDKRGVDLAFDGVGEAIWPDILRSLARDGRLVTYGATTGPRGQVEIRLVFWKQLRIIGTTMSRPLERAREAHERLEAGDAFGKIVLTP
jgi:NADPH:quinone reductase-like Zn-dependent oxidoreductase